MKTGKVRVLRDSLARGKGGDPAYAAAKFRQATETLATRFGTLRERLWYAYRDFQPVSAHDMPPHLLGALQSLKQDFGRLEPNARDEDRIGATVGRIRRSGCEDLARRVVQICDALDEWMRSQRPSV